MKKIKKCKAPWNGTHEMIYLKKKKISSPYFHVLINGRTITYKLSITENFNIFVCQSKKTLQNKIYPCKRDHCYYIQCSNPNNFTLVNSPAEVTDITQDLKTCIQNHWPK